MKAYAVVAALSLIFALGAGLAYVSNDRRAPSIDEITSIKSDFVKSAKPVGTVELGSIELDPNAVLPKTFEFDYTEITKFHEAVDQCRLQGFKPKDPSLKKALEWHSWICGQAARPAAEFFSKEPRYHPLGGTYVARSLARMRDDSEWVKANLKGLHASEYRDVDPALLSEGQRFLATLSLDDLGRLRESDTVMRADSRIWIRRAVKDFSEASYDVYDASHWDDRLKNAPFIFKAWSEDDASCARWEGRGCWVRNEERQNLPAKLLILALTISLLTTTVSSALLIRQWLKERRRDDEDRRFVLQMLTHELRTPATSLNLNIESIREGFDRLAPTQQDSFLRMCNDIQRLKNVIEASNAYLQSDRTEGVKVRAVRIPSLNQWVGQVLEEENQPVNFAPLPSDRSLRADPYWLGLCLRNLVRNAFDHGEPPVTVRLDTEPELVRISVRDEGPAKLVLKDIVKPFEKQNRSRGLGLGLHLVQRLLEPMNGRLEYKNDPTTFTIILEKT